MSNDKIETGYFDKIDYILQSLANRVDRDKIALELGYTNPKSLDIYMRRKGFLYDKSKGNYIPIKAVNITETQTFNTDKRLNTILSLFSNENADPRKIAEITGFESHIELAEYMKTNNFSWNDSFGNYIREINKENNHIDVINDATLDTSEFFIYLPLLRKLNENKDKLFSMLDSQQNAITLVSAVIEGNTQQIQLSINSNLQATINIHLKQSHLTLDKFFELAVVNYLKNSSTNTDAPQCTPKP